MFFLILILTLPLSLKFDSCSDPKHPEINIPIRVIAERTDNNNDIVNFVSGLNGIANMDNLFSLKIQFQLEIYSSSIENTDPFKDAYCIVMHKTSNTNNRISTVASYRFPDQKELLFDIPAIIANTNPHDLTKDDAFVMFDHLAPLIRIQINDDVVGRIIGSPKFPLYDDYGTLKSCSPNNKMYIDKVCTNTQTTRVPHVSSESQLHYKSCQSNPSARDVPCKGVTVLEQNAKTLKFAYIDKGWRPYIANTHVNDNSKQLQKLDNKNIIRIESYSLIFRIKLDDKLIPYRDIVKSIFSAIAEKCINCKSIDVFFDQHEYNLEIKTFNDNPAAYGMTEGTIYTNCDKTKIRISSNLLTIFKNDLKIVIGHEVSHIFAILHTETGIMSASYSNSHMTTLDEFIIPERPRDQFLRSIDPYTNDSPMVYIRSYKGFKLYGATRRTGLMFRFDFPINDPAYINIEDHIKNRLKSKDDIRVYTTKCDAFNVNSATKQWTSSKELTYQNMPSITECAHLGVSVQYCALVVQVQNTNEVTYYVNLGDNTGIYKLKIGDIEYAIMCSGNHQIFPPTKL